MFFLTVDDLKYFSLNRVTFTQKKMVFCKTDLPTASLKFLQRIIVYLLTKNKLLMTPKA